MSYRYFSVDSYSTVLTHDQFLADSGQKASRLFYLFDTPNRKAETSAERYLKRQTSVPASELSFDSRSSQRASLNSFKHLFIICGGFLCAVIALIGTLNFINAILTGILTRQHDLPCCSPLHDEPSASHHADRRRPVLRHQRIAACPGAVDRTDLSDRTYVYQHRLVLHGAPNTCTGIYCRSRISDCRMHCSCTALSSGKQGQCS